MKNILVCIAVLFAVNVYAQKDSTNTESKYSWKFDKKRITYGGGIGGGISNGVTSVNFSPILAYRFTDKFMAGPRLSYNYYSFQNSRGFSNFGYSLLGRYMFNSQIFGHIEYENMYTTRWSNARRRIPAMLVGAGYY